MIISNGFFLGKGQQYHLYSRNNLKGVGIKKWEEREGDREKGRKKLLSID